MTEENGITYPNIRQSWGIVGISLLFLILFSPVSILLDDLIGKEISFLLYYLLAMGSVFLIAHFKRKKWTSASDYGFDFSSAKIMILVFIGVIAIQIGIISPIVNVVPMPEFFQKVFLEFAKRNGVFSFITIVIAAPILEELIFRGIILNGLLKKYSSLKSIIVSSVLFGIVHLNPWQFIAALIIGIFSGWVYYKTGKLTLSILIHFTNNLFAFGSLYFVDVENSFDKSLAELYGGSSNLILITLGAIVVAVVCLYFLKLEIKSAEANYVSTQHYT